ncbi:hypothetical protein N7474_003322 [Penicillium riverlandense]|uniref:uncharacterized protein n=1 Tax=Penicillium riverlandense TaxID=1903569 RepID=UPI002547C5E6|nr:uncharacterized protein N7474_003322 [Penicillium riverlandense]KAJ5826184.1 hypothetical protein N7474_003322 [Penicillium riverlandense]
MDCVGVEVASPPNIEATNTEGIYTPSSLQKANIEPSASSASTNPQAYVGDISFMSPVTSQHEPLQLPVALRSTRDSFSGALIRTMGATSLPPQGKIDGLVDIYFKNLYHRAPIVDRKDLLAGKSSVLLLQSLCLIGTLLRHPGIESTLEESERYYCKVKALLYVNHEKDHHTVLKCLCFLLFRNYTPPTVVSLDCSWHWMGMAVRLAQQMGLHREPTYANLQNSGNARRIMWFLFVEDKLQTACFGRPSTVGSLEFDLRPLRLTDFDCQNSQAELFVEYVKLNVILGKILDSHSRKNDFAYSEATSILQSLQNWLHSLPDHLQLYNEFDRSPFRRDVHEIHINYFVCVIVFCRLLGISIPRSTATAASLVASSCIARLYEEMHFRDEINYLMPMNNWFLMAGCAPQIHQNAVSRGKDQLCTEELRIFTKVLEYMRIKWPATGTLLDILARLCAIDSNEVLRHGQDANGSQDTECMNGSWTIRVPGSEVLKGLFPFPSTLSPRLVLVEEESEEFDDQLVPEKSWDLGDDDLDWIFNQYQLAF